MLELRVLGSVDLRTTSGSEHRAVLQQPKRLGLLVYLALARPGLFHRRDSLLADFWPELDEPHARASLRRALYFLRQYLGNEVIVSRGEEEVAVAGDLLWCDALAFEERLTAGDTAAALDLYRGELLPGLYVAGAPGIERWLEEERVRLRQRAADAAWSLAEKATAPDEAARRARQAARTRRTMSRPWSASSRCWAATACATRPSGPTMLTPDSWRLRNCPGPAPNSPDWPGTCAPLAMPPTTG